MLTVILPATNHKAQWVEIQVDGHHAGRIWAHSVEVFLENAVRQFMVSIQTDHVVHYLWADRIQQASD